MEDLNRRMAEDMKLRSLASGTQRGYMDAIMALAKHYHRRPDQLSQEQIRDYLLYLIETRKVAKSTFKIHRSALKFLYRRTLGRPWPVLELPRIKSEKKLSGAPAGGPDRFRDVESEQAARPERNTTQNRCLTPWSVRFRVVRGEGLLGQVGHQQEWQCRAHLRDRRSRGNQPGTETAAAFAPGSTSDGFGGRSICQEILARCGHNGNGIALRIPPESNACFAA
jgi:hypothetical protein